MTDSRSQFDPLEALTVMEVAELLHVSRPTVEKHIKTGELPSITIGRCRRIRRMDLEDFLDRRTAYGWQRHRPGLTPHDGPPMDCQGPDADEGESIPF